MGKYQHIPHLTHGATMIFAVCTDAVSVKPLSEDVKLLNTTAFNGKKTFPGQVILQSSPTDTTDDKISTGNKEVLSETLLCFRHFAFCFTSIPVQGYCSSGNLPKEKPYYLVCNKTNLEGLH